MFLSVDIGGTFTDLVSFDPVSQTIRHAKSLTTPDNLVEGVLDCVQKSSASLSDVQQLIHGSTIAINTLIERKGARTALLVTRGTRDAYAIGRGNRSDAYNLRFRRPQPLVPRDEIFEVGARMLADGSELRPVDEEEVCDIAERIRKGDFDSVAVCFLHSYASTAHEKQVGEILTGLLPGLYVSLSHEIMREYREYERISTTVVNSYVGPKVSGYVSRLENGLSGMGFGGELSIMQSNGGVMSPSIAAQRPVMMMESGPVGGIIAGAEVARLLGYPNIVSFDMGGTTAKASLVQDNTPVIADGYYVNGYATGDPVMVPVVDVVEVGTGGGSIAWIDEVGALKVGPRSAGAAPGPISYGRGGTEPTITDANLVLGRLSAGGILGGEMQLDLEGARAGLAAKVADPLGLTVPEAALAIVEIGVAKMSLAVREVSVQKGHDPRDFALVASGGAGPLHAVAVARDLGIPTLIVPVLPSHFSAVGMLLADERHDMVRTYLAPIDSCDFTRIGQIVDELESEAAAITRSDDPEKSIAFDLRYLGQEFSLTIPVTRNQIDAGRGDEIRAAFDRTHETRYAHFAESEPVEIINIRLVVRGNDDKIAVPAPQAEPAEPESRPIHMGRGDPVPTAVHQRSALGPGMVIRGPALVQEYGTTTVIYDGDSLEVAPGGELIVKLGYDQ